MASYTSFQFAHNVNSAITFFMEPLEVSLSANSVVTLLVNSRGWSSWTKHEKLAIKLLLSHSGFLSNLRLPWKQIVTWNFSLYWIYFLHSRFLSNLCLPWKQSLPWNFSIRSGGSPPASYAYGSLWWMYDYLVLAT